MRRPTLLLVLATAVAAPAAEVTRVASAFEPGRPFGMYLDFTFDRLQEKGSIVREWYGAPTPEVRELQYLRLDSTLQLDAHLGLYRDLELHVGVPVVFQQDRSWRFDASSGPAISTLYRNCTSARGVPCSTPGAGTGRLFEVSDATTAYRAGLGDFTFGLAWAPFVQAKDPSKPTWVVRLDWTVPTSARLDATAPTSSTARGLIGEGYHRFSVSTALSRRLGFAEPYLELRYTLPWAGPDAASNCDHPGVLARPENCAAQGGTWERAETGLQPPHTGSVLFGTELTLAERPETRQRLAVDLRATLTYVSAGRYFNELSDLLQRLLSSGDHAQVGGQLTLLGQPAAFFTLKATASIAYTTERFLTSESPARGAAATLPADLSQPVPELNPSYDFRVDQPGRRLRMTDEFAFRAQVAAVFTF
jgi:hypothetical protein